MRFYLFLKLESLLNLPGVAIYEKSAWRVCLGGHVFLQKGQDHILEFKKYIYQS